MEEKREELEEEEEGREELVLSGVGQVSLLECFISVPGQPRFAAVVLPVSTILTDRWTEKPAFPHWAELGSWGDSGLSDCCPHWPEDSNAVSEGSGGR